MVRAARNSPNIFMWPLGIRREWKWRYPIPEGRDVVEVNVDLRTTTSKELGRRQQNDVRLRFEVSRSIRYI